MKRENDWVDAFMFVLCIAFCIFCIMIVGTSYAHDRDRQPPATPEVWTGPEIQQCDKELWLRVKDGCQEGET